MVTLFAQELAEPSRTGLPPSSAGAEHHDGMGPQPLTQSIECFAAEAYFDGGLNACIARQGEET